MHKVLIVEDDKTTSFLIEQALSNQGIDAETSDDGLVALNKIQENKYDLVITDVYLPSKDGLTLLRDIKEIHPETKVLVMSGGTFKGYDVLKMALMEGAYKTIKKPDDIKNIAHIVKNCLESS